MNMLFQAIATVRVVFAGNRAHFLAMNRVLAGHRLRPTIDRTFSFDRAVDAFRHYESAAAFGKVVIRHGH